MKRSTVIACLMFMSTSVLADFWSQIRNPVYSHTGWATKDACMAELNGVYYIFTSAFYADRGTERSHVTCITTKDFKTYSDTLFMWDGRADGWKGMCSPDIKFYNGKWYLTYNSWGDVSTTKPNQLFYAVSTDLRTWEKDKPLATNITAGIRSIDAALALHKGVWYMVYKKVQIAKILTAKDIDGPWTEVGQPTGVSENGSFEYIDGKWHMTMSKDLTTRIGKMKGTGDVAKDWLSWTFTEVPVPRESFNTNNLSNAGFLVDWRKKDGYFYVIYAGTTENNSHAGRGNCKLALIRSKDLVKWFVPPQGIAVATMPAVASQNVVAPGQLIHPKSALSESQVSVGTEKAVFNLSGKVHKTGRQSSSAINNQ